MHVVRETSKIGETPENAIPELLLASLRYGGAKKPSLLIHNCSRHRRASQKPVRVSPYSHSALETEPKRLEHPARCDYQTVTAPKWAVFFLSFRSRNRCMLPLIPNIRKGKPFKRHVMGRTARQAAVSCRPWMEIICRTRSHTRGEPVGCAARHKLAAPIISLFTIEWKIGSQLLG